MLVKQMFTDLLKFLLTLSISVLLKAYHSHVNMGVFWITVRLEGCLSREHSTRKVRLDSSYCLVLTLQ